MKRPHRCSQTKEQSSCSKWTGISLQTEHCCENWEPLRRGFWAEPRRAICLGGVEVVRRMASRKPCEGPMTRTKSKRKTATRSWPVKTAKRKSSKRSVPVDAVSGPLAKARAGTKNAQVVAMLRDRAGTTIAAIMAATGWQQHSVRGFLAGVVRKKLGLNLVSEPGESGRVYRIIDDMASPAKTDRVRQAA
jgi:Protein of unknown function (DUF3489)